MVKRFVYSLSLILSALTFACQTPQDERIVVEKLQLESYCQDSEEHYSLSWTINSILPRGIKQEGYRVLMASKPELLDQDRSDLWDSGKKGSDQQFDIPYLGKPLHRDSSYYAKIMLWTNVGKSPWSTVETLRLPAAELLSESAPVNKYDAYDLRLGDLLNLAKTATEEKYVRHSKQLLFMDASACWSESYLLDNRELYIQWMDQLAAAQTEEACMPKLVQQNPLSFLNVADMLYSQYAEIRPIANHYLAMEKWLAYLWANYAQENMLMGETKTGKTMMPLEDISLDGKQYFTSSSLISTAYFFRMSVLMEKFSRVLDLPAKASYYSEQAIKIRNAFNAHFYHPETQYYENNSLTANLLSISLGLCDEKNCDKVFKQIEKAIAIDHYGKAPCGDLGKQYLFTTLSAYGRADLAYRIASVQEEASGDYVLWFFEHLCGIKSLKPGFKQIRLDAVYPQGIYFAQTRLDTRMGRMSSSWIKTAEVFVWQIKVPANTTAILRYPTASVDDVFEDGHSPEQVDGIQVLGMENGNVLMELASGDYYFLSKLSKFIPVKPEIN